jgi:hypothetical protein
VAISCRSGVVKTALRSTQRADFVGEALPGYRSVVDAQRRKLLDAYYLGAVDITTLREEQERLGNEKRDIED